MSLQYYNKHNIMKKTIITIIAIIICMAADTASAQLDQFANSGPIAQDLIDGSFITETAEGDLNKDGVKDLVVGVPEGVAIYWGSNNGYKLYNTYRCLSVDLDTLKFIRSTTINSKGVLRIEYNITVQSPNPKVSNANYVYMLRYQDNDFFLIGCKFAMVVNGQFIAISINTLTNKAIIQDKKGNAITESYDIPEAPLKSISEVVFEEPRFFEEYLNPLFENDDPKILKEYFVYHILEQMSELENQTEHPCLNKNGFNKFMNSAFGDLSSWGKDSHQTFEINWKHSYYDEYVDAQLDCFPLKDGGYFVMFKVTETGDYEHYFYYNYVFKDNKLTRNDSYLPKPTINDYYSNAAKFPKKIYNALNRELQYPEYFYSQEDKTLTVTFDPWLCDETGCDLPEDLQCFQGNDDGDTPSFPTAVYVWKDGKFVFAPDYKPLEENLNYFK